jgi:hypothetical protein
MTFWFLKDDREKSRISPDKTFSRSQMSLFDGYCVGQYKVVKDHPDFYLIELKKENTSALKTNSCAKPTIQSSQKRVQISTILTSSKKIVGDSDEDTESEVSESDCEPVVKKLRFACRQTYDEDDFMGEDEALAYIDQVEDERDKISLQLDDRKERSIIYYDKNGNLLTSFKLDVVAVIALENGTIISPYHKAEIICFYTDSDNVQKFAPGSISKIHDKNDVWLNWGKRDAKVKEKDSRLPISTILSSTRTVPRKVREKLMIEYFAHLNKKFASPFLMALHSAPNLARDEFADLYDYLEMFHIQTKFIFRTALGEYIFKQFIQPFQNFGKRGEKFCFDLINKTWTCFDSAPLSTKNGTCQACALPRELTWRIAGLDLGADCKSRIDYFRNVRKLLVQFLGQGSFQPSSGRTLILNLQNESGDFQKVLSKIRRKYESLTNEEC